ncbi:hypothetical protein DFH09DRAFT_1300001 [Mycena vulgaris]|nr:hypothetical protein DFH09DRAFT_1300001 [Mycena vulgaris]
MSMTTTTTRASLSSSISIPNSTNTTNTLATSSSNTGSMATSSSQATTRVRFDAECTLIPDMPFSKRPKMVTKSYSLPLWRKPRDEQVVLKVALPSFKSKTRATSRSPPPVAHSIPSCLRAAPASLPLCDPSLTAPFPTDPSTPTAHAPRTPFSTLSAIYTSPAATTTIYAGAGGPRTVPLRACCPECAAHADVPEEAFSRGAQRVRRRTASGTGGSTLFAAAQAGGFLTGVDADAPPLMHATGLAEVNRLVAELERRRASATPSPTPSAGGGKGSGEGGRASPSLLGPALARVIEGGAGYGERLAPADGRSGSGRASPLLPLGIAVDEVDKERRRRSVDLGGLRRGLAAGAALEGVEDDGCAVPSSAPATATAYAKMTQIHACADDDDADLFPLPSRSSTPRSTPAPSPKGSPVGSDLSVHRVGGKGSPKVPSALGPGAEGRDHARDCSDGARERERERERSRSEAVCIALGSGGRRAREEREKVEKCERGLLCPPGSGSGSKESSRNSSREREARDVDKPLPVLPRLATSVLAAGPYSPALAPRVDPAASRGGGSHHLRVASAPAGSPTTLSGSASVGAGFPSSAPASAPKPIVASASASASTSTSTSASAPTSTSPLTRSTSTSPRAPALPPPPSPTLRRAASSSSRLRSPSTSSTGKAGRKAFGALVDVLKGNDADDAGYWFIPALSTFLAPLPAVRMDSSLRLGPRPIGPRPIGPLAFRRFVPPVYIFSSSALLLRILFFARHHRIASRPPHPHPHPAPKSTTTTYPPLYLT